MRLGARVLRGVVSANSFEFTNQFEHNQQSADDLYIQLMNVDNNVGGTPPGIRYLPAAGAVVTLTMPSIDASRVGTYTMTQAFPGDGSIWHASILASDNFGSGNIVVSVNESAVIRTATIINGSRVTPTNPSRCTF